MINGINCNPIILGTSLAPFNIEKQIKAVKSWIDNGFYVVSCNVNEEIKLLREAFISLNIEFIEVERTSEEICGKKLPYIQDILNIVGSRAEKVCGFINSDIILSHMPDGMYEFIMNETLKSIVFGRRNEIDQYTDIENLDWEVHFDGIDFFFMDTSLVYNFFNDDFYVQSMWDLCILIKCKVLGIEIKELVNPIAFHLRHKIKWDFKESGLLVKRFMKKYFDFGGNEYSHALDLFYKILYEYSHQICFCNNQSQSCLFILNQKNDSIIESINDQEDFHNEIRYSDEEKESFDIVFYFYGELVLSKIFCKLIVYIMEQFDCKSLNVGKFFASTAKEEMGYNQLSRNLKIVKKINADSKTLTRVFRKDGKKEGTLYLPISHEIIYMNDMDVVDTGDLDTEIYIMPAGVRASEWYDMNKDKIGWKIAGYIDNNKNKIGSEIEGKPICSINILKNRREKAFVIVASKYYSVEIEQQLSEIIDKSRIINASYIFSINSDATFNCFNLDKYKENRNKLHEEVME